MYKVDKEKHRIYMRAYGVKNNARIRELKKIRIAKRIKEDPRYALTLKLKRREYRLKYKSNPLNVLKIKAAKKREYRLGKRYKDYSLERKEKINERRRLYRLNGMDRWNRYRVRYGVSKEQYLTMLESQNLCCKICRKPFVSRRLTFLDHNHKTMKARAILCVNCNSLLGHSKESILILKRAIWYINYYNLNVKNYVSEDLSKFFK